MCNSITFIFPGFSIEGPSQAKIECCDNQDGSATICYWPTTPGEYAVHVLCDGEDIQNSPYMANILPSNDKSDVSKVKILGRRSFVLITII